jgi:hypothetical protein
LIVLLLTACGGSKPYAIKNKQDFIMFDTLYNKLYKYPELDTAILSLPGKVFREEYLIDK